MARVTHLSLDSMHTPEYVSSFASHLSIRGALTQRESPLHPNWKLEYKYEAPGGSLSARAFRLPGLGTIPASQTDPMIPNTSSDLKVVGARERVRSKGGASSSCRCPLTPRRASSLADRAATYARSHTVLYAGRRRAPAAARPVGAGGTSARPATFAAAARRRSRRRRRTRAARSGGAATPAMATPAMAPRVRPPS